ncbi:MAG: anaerobic ribonucleoside-triphosphate reductase activating protein [Catonella sp.]|nr:anaerobic ribonucleoside-triphosphate reductase activating protein [Catonella sp.]
MNFGQIFTADIANGTGMRVSLFVSGCTNHCKGCFQPETWDFAYGKPYTKETEDTIIKELSKPYYEGLSILGGEPFEVENQEDVCRLILRARRECPKKNIWMYTGFLYDVDLAPGGKRYTEFTGSILDNIDVLVDGPFIEEQKNISLRFRGSKNQRIIDVRASRKSGSLVNWDDGR